MSKSLSFSPNWAIPGCWAAMIHLLFALVFAETAPIVILSFKTPLRRFMIMGLDRAKRGRGPVVAKTVAGTIAVVLMARVYSFMEIQSRYSDTGSINPTDQVLMGQYLLEASLMGFSLFLAWMVDKLHHYIRELRLLRTSMKIANQNQYSNDGKIQASEVTKTMKEEDAHLSTNNEQLESEVGLKMKIKQLECECEKKKKKAKIAEANSTALRKQLERFRLEYNYLLEENQNLRNQLQLIDSSFSSLESKKNE